MKAFLVLMALLGLTACGKDSQPHGEAIQSPLNASAATVTDPYAQVQKLFRAYGDYQIDLTAVKDGSEFQIPFQTSDARLCIGTGIVVPNGSGFLIGFKTVGTDSAAYAAMKPPIPSWNQPSCFDQVGFYKLVPFGSDFLIYQATALGDMIPGTKAVIVSSN